MEECKAQEAASSVPLCVLVEVPTALPTAHSMGQKPLEKPLDGSPSVTPFTSFAGQQLFRTIYSGPFSPVRVMKPWVHSPGMTPLLLPHATSLHFPSSHPCLKLHETKSKQALLGGRTGNSDGIGTSRCTPLTGPCIFVS